MFFFFEENVRKGLENKNFFFIEKEKKDLLLKKEKEEKIFKTNLKLKKKRKELKILKKLSLKKKKIFEKTKIKLKRKIKKIKPENLQNTKMLSILDFNEIYQNGIFYSGSIFPLFYKILFLLELIKNLNEDKIIIFLKKLNLNFPKEIIISLDSDLIDLYNFYQEEFKNFNFNFPENNEIDSLIDNFLDNNFDIFLEENQILNRNISKIFIRNIFLFNLKNYQIFLKNQEKEKNGEESEKSETKEVYKKTIFKFHLRNFNFDSTKEKLNYIIKIQKSLKTTLKENYDKKKFEEFNKNSEIEQFLKSTYNKKKKFYEEDEKINYLNFISKELPSFVMNLPVDEKISNLLFEKLKTIFRSVNINLNTIDISFENLLLGNENIIEGKIENTNDEKIENKDEIKIENKNVVKIEDKSEKKIESKNDKKIEEIEDKNDKKVEEKIEDKIENKIDEKLVNKENKKNEIKIENKTNEIKFEEKKNEIKIEEKKDEIIIDQKMENEKTIKIENQEKKEIFKDIKNSDSKSNDDGEKIEKKIFDKNSFYNLIRYKDKLFLDKLGSEKKHFLIFDVEM